MATQVTLHLLMGLIFALQPELRKATPTHLALKSQKTRFSMGMGFLFLFCLLITMYMVASPLFKMMWYEGGLFDQSLVIFFYILVVLAIVASIYCWFFEEVVLIEKKGSTFELKAYNKFFGIKWKRRNATLSTLDEFKVENYLASMNVAKIQSNKKGKPDRYATRGHYLLKVGDVTFEKRASPG